MFLAETDAQDQFRQSVRRALQDAQPTLGAALRSPELIDCGLAEAGAVGGLAIGLSEDVGGIPDSTLEFAIFHAEVGRSITAAPISSNIVLGGVLLDQCSPEPLRATIMAHLIAGEVSVAVAGFAPRTGSILAEEQAGDWSLTGRCHMVLGLPQADKVVILANLGATPLLFLTDAKLVASDPYRLVDGRSAGNIEVDRAILPHECLLAQGKPVHAAMRLATQKMLRALSAEALGSAERMIELTTQYMQVREQFGQPIAGFQALQHILAEMVVDFEMSKSLLEAALIDAAPESDQADFMNAMLSIRVPAHAVTIGERAIQIHGGMGITEEYEVGHHYRRALVNAELARSLSHDARMVVEGHAATIRAGDVQ